MVDTGADVTIISTSTANSIKLDTSRPQGSLNLIGVTGNNAAPLVNVAMKIETQQAFVTQIAVAPSNFNLLCMRDLSRVYDVNIRGGQASLIPRGQAGALAINTLPSIQTDVVPIPTLNLNDNQLKAGVLLATGLLVLGVLS